MSSPFFKHTGQIQHPHLSATPHCLYGHSPCLPILPPFKAHLLQEAHGVSCCLQSHPCLYPTPGLRDVSSWLGFLLPEQNCCSACDWSIKLAGVGRQEQPFVFSALTPTPAQV